MKRFMVGAFAALLLVFAFVSDAFAQRCGHHFRPDGTMMISVTKQSTCGPKGWQHNGYGQRYWHGGNQRVVVRRPYYESRPRVQERTVVRQVHREASYHREDRGRRVYHDDRSYDRRSSTSSSEQRSYGSPGKPVSAPASACPRVNATPVRNTSCRPGDQQFSYQGQSNYCLPPASSPNAYTCFNTATNRLAWYTP